MGQTSSNEATLGLTTREIELICTVWSFIRQDIPKNGPHVFIMFLEMFPDYKQYFKYIDVKSPLHLNANPIIKIHSIKILEGMDLVIGNLTNPGKFLAILHKIAKEHNNIDVPRAAFLDFRFAMLSFLPHIIPESKRPPGAFEAFEKGLELMLTVLADFCEKACSCSNENKCCKWDTK